jgi:hypothetical protein
VLYVCFFFVCEGVAVAVVLFNVTEFQILIADEEN